jgi:HK97 family phage major capsid protein/ATP-dependent Clp endopeptidase proteolytic subunit ClpP
VRIVKNSWYSMSAKDTGLVEVFIYGEIGAWDIGADAFAKDLRAHKGKDISLRLNTPGGSVFDGMAIYNALKRHDGEVTCFIDGLAASIGSVIALAGDTVSMAKNAFFMIHNPWAVMVGNADDIRKTAALLDKIKGAMVNAYADKSGLDHATIGAWMDAETWFTAAEAEDAGFCDEVGDEIELAASFSFLSKFRNVPASLLAGRGKVQPETLREMEKRFRSEGRSRREAARLAEEVQNKKDGDDDMTPEQIANLNAAVAGLREVNGLKAQLEAAVQKMDRHSPGGGGVQSGAAKAKAEYAKAFSAFMRFGDESGLQKIQAGADVNTVTDDEGGYGVPEELDRRVGVLMENINPMRQLCRVIKAGLAGYTKLFSVGGMASGWVGETDARPKTAASGLVALTPPYGEIYANPASTQRALDDIFFDAEAWIIEEIAKEFSFQEGSSFLTGNGILKPKGVLAYTNTNEVDSARAFGSLQYIPTGAAADFATASSTVSPSDVLFDCTYSLKAGHRAGASWLANSLTLARVRKFKDAEGRPIWVDSIAVGQPALLCGFPIYLCEDMDNIGANKYPLAFGNWRVGYTIVDPAGGTKLVRDPFTSKPYVFFYTTKRVGGFVEDSQAIKLVKCAVA